MKRLIAIVFAVLVLGACGASTAAKSSTKVGPQATDPTTEAPTTTTTVPELPTAKNFVVSLQVLDNQCFDTAGAVMTVRAKIGNRGPDVPDDVSWELTYEIRGAGDIQTHTITGTGGHYDVGPEMLDTPQCNMTPRGVVTSFEISTHG